MASPLQSVELVYQIPGMFILAHSDIGLTVADSPEADRAALGIIPETRVLIVMTGGTICMEKSERGYVPARNFLERCMANRPEFNDGTEQEDIEVRVEVTGSMKSRKLSSLRTPLSSYGKRVRYGPGQSVDRGCY
jgi:hypothetical protein